GMIAPIAHSGGTTTWAPASAAYLDGSRYFGGLRGEALYEAVSEGDKVARVMPHLKGELCRIREVVAGPDGLLIITTSNTHGRGRVREGDDSIIEVNPSKL